MKSGALPRLRRSSTSSVSSSPHLSHFSGWYFLGYIFMGVLQPWYGRIGVTTTFTVYLVPHAFLEGRGKGSCCSALVLVPLEDALPGSRECELPAPGFHLSQVFAAVGREHFTWLEVVDPKPCTGSSTHGQNTRAPSKNRLQGTDPRNGRLLLLVSSWLSLAVSPLRGSLPGCSLRLRRARSSVFLCV